MKIRPSDYNTLRNAIHLTMLVTGQTPERQAEYKTRGWTPKRYRWQIVDVLNIRIFGAGPESGMPEDESKGNLNLYAYLNDDHIDTALRAVFKELGYEWASQK
jgi:hypothetical protein